MNRATPSLFTTWAIAGGVATALYLSTRIPGLAWGDSGDAQLRMLLGHFYDRNDWSRSHILFYAVAGLVNRCGAAPASAVTIVSAVAGGVTVANVAVLLRLLDCRTVAVLSGAAMLALSHSLWHLSTVPEVMSLSTALLTLELICILRFARHQAPGWLAAGAFLNGLGLSTHSMAMLVWPAYGVLALVALCGKPRMTLRSLSVAVVAFLIGALPAIVLFIHLVRSFGDPANVFAEMLTGRFSRHVYNTHDSFRLAVGMLAYTAYALPTPIALASVTGIRDLVQRGPRPWPAFFLIASATLLVFAVRYNVPDQHVFMLHSIVLACVVAAVGVERLVARWPQRFVLAGVMCIAATGPTVYAVVPIILRNHPDLVPVPHRHVPHRDALAWFLRPWHAGDDGPETMAREVLDTLPLDSIVSVDSTLMPPLLYLQNSEGLRRDVRIIQADPFQTWFESRFDIGDENARNDAVRRGLLFAVSPEREYWSGHLQDDMYDVEPFGTVFRFVLAGRSIHTAGRRD